MFARLIAFVRGLAARRRVTHEIDEELSFHLAHETDRHIAEGVAPDEARRRALRDLGGLTQTAEDVRGVRTLRLEAFWFDVRDAVRGLVRERGFTAVAFITLTLVVGANAAILSIADAVLFRPMPYADPDRVKILQVLDRKSGQQSTMTPYALLDAIDRLDGVVSRAGLATTGPQVTADTPDGPTPVETASVSPGYFDTLGVRPIRGRLFDAADADASGRTVLLSYAAWQNRFGGRDDIVGSTIKFRQSSFDVIGVLPAGFVFPSLFVGKPELVTQQPPRAIGATGGTFHAIVRVSPAVSVSRAQAAIDAAVTPVVDTMPSFAGQTIVLNDSREVLYGLVSAPIMRFLLASAALTLIIGCANLANMLLVRGQRRTRETALRLALGAGRGRLVRPIIVEALLLGMLAAAASLLLTSAGFEALLRQVPRIAYGNAPIGVSLRVVAMSIGLSLIGAFVFAAVPAWRTAKADMRGLLQGQERRRIASRAWLGRPLVALQIALALVAVFGAVVAARAFVSVLNTPLGFSPDGVVTINVAPPRPTNPPPSRVVSVAPDRIDVANPPRPPDATAFYRRVIDAIKTTSEVVSVGATTSLPLSGSAPYTTASLPGVPPEQREGRVLVDYVFPGFFETVSMTLRSGRTLTWDDLTADPGALVISSSVASALFAGRDPIGQTLIERGTNRELHVVGVVEDIRQSLERAEPGRSFALPAEGRGRPIVVARVRDASDAVLTRLKASVRAVAPDSLVVARWWSDSIAGTNAYRNPRFQTIVLGTLATLAVSLTAIGVFGVLNYLVVTRTRDMGVRLALGAPRPSLMRFVVGRAMIPVAMGLAAGLGIIALVKPLAEAQLYHVNTHDPLTIVIAALAVTFAALVAAYVPARRAASIDLVSVLRSE